MRVAVRPPLRVAFIALVFFLALLATLVKHSSPTPSSMLEDMNGSGQLVLGDDALLPYIEFNRGAERTVLLIHGAFGDHSDWDLVWPYLTDYHVLVPDLPGHGAAFTNTPFSVPRASRMLRKLIRARAHNGTAHVVGLSLGAQVGVHLVAQYPEVVAASMVSGFSVSSRKSALSPILPYAVWVMARIEWAIPRFVIRWLMDGADLRRPDLSKVTLELIRQVFDSDSAGEPYEKWPRPWPTRTLVVAAGKKGLLPSNDNADQARTLASIGRQLNEYTLAVTNPDIRHPWCRQVPALFAETMQDWIAQKELPRGFIWL